MITHRCEGSLKNQMSIRYTNQYGNFNISYDYEAWRLFKPTDSDYGSTFLSHVSEIKFCPFCGKELKDMNKENVKIEIQ